MNNAFSNIIFFMGYKSVTDFADSLTNLSVSLLSNVTVAQFYST